MGPFLFFIAYDVILYIWRAATYEIPVIGGRARGRRRPVVPSFSETASGRRRAFSMTGVEFYSSRSEAPLTRAGQNENVAPHKAAPDAALSQRKPFTLPFDTRKD
ncbi:conserved hypothetical protein [Microsporum canis CBS 113480]|uniref:Uncharacterized protein n=1 Tax=Arthroderma otae (strain ATCC MYA-4605 / CBS 113480) TaxID=554155 RepID=C5FS99_ARTOC|nr:conserved hypothetical protein [Microsporum canis CBS 113480]EEQ32752.1 conserved hypothetical protein [Microsporum canis CBS 113480]